MVRTSQLNVIDMPNDCDIDKPALPAVSVSRDMIANSAASMVIKFPRSSSLNASHLEEINYKIKRLKIVLKIFLVPVRNRNSISRLKALINKILHHFHETIRLPIGSYGHYASLRFAKMSEYGRFTCALHSLQLPIRGNKIALHKHVHHYHGYQSQKDERRRTRYNNHRRTQAQNTFDK
jgi:hypothetical protein